MKRKERKRESPLSPVFHAELSEKHIRLRAVLIAVFVVAALAAFGFGIYNALSVESGWREIEAVTDAQTLCTQELVLQYNLGASGVSATAEYKAVARLYTDAADTAYRLFGSEQYDDCTNLSTLNAQVNQAVEVDPALYAALSTVQDSGSRYLFLAPILQQYDTLFSCTYDEEAALADPYQNQELREDFARIAAYANDPEMIRLELLAGNQVRLTVSQEYLRFAREDGITRFIDFSWLRNAFILDYVAQCLTDRGYCYGTISSFDGFSRALGTENTEYSFNVYDMVDQTVCSAAVMSCKAPFSIVNLRSYPLNSLDSLRYYAFENGEIRSAFVDQTDGLCKSAVNDLTCVSEQYGCAQVALAALPVYAADEWDESAVLALRKDGIAAVYCVDREIRCTDEQIRFTNLYQQDGVAYTVKQIS